MATLQCTTSEADLFASLQQLTDVAQKLVEDEGSAPSKHAEAIEKATGKLCVTSCPSKAPIISPPIPAASPVKVPPVKVPPVKVPASPVQAQAPVPSGNGATDATSSGPPPPPPPPGPPPPGPPPVRTDTDAIKQMPKKALQKTPKKASEHAANSSKKPDLLAEIRLGKKPKGDENQGPVFRAMTATSGEELAKLVDVFAKLNPAQKREEVNQKHFINKVRTRWNDLDEEGKKRVLKIVANRNNMFTPELRMDLARAKDLVEVEDSAFGDTILFDEHERAEYKLALNKQAQMDLGSDSAESSDDDSWSTDGGGALGGGEGDSAVVFAPCIRRSLVRLLTEDPTATAQSCVKRLTRCDFARLNTAAYGGDEMLIRFMASTGVKRKELEYAVKALHPRLTSM